MSCHLHQESREWLQLYAPGHFSPEMADAEVERALLRATKALQEILTGVHELMDDAAAEMGLYIPLRLPEEEV